MLILPFFIVAFGLSFIICIRYYTNKKDKSTSKILIVTLLTLLILLDILTFWITIKCFIISIEKYGYPLFNFYQFSNLTIGGIFLILGVVLLFFSNYQGFGIRTKISLQNELIWNKSQKVSGLTLI